MSCYIEDPAAKSEEQTEYGLLKGHAYAITGMRLDPFDLATSWLIYFS